MGSIIDKAIQTLEGSGIIGFPTDTVYGIGCDASNQEAVKKIYLLKKRPPDKKLILFIRDESELKKYALVPQIGEPLIEKFWPGKLTIIFPAKPDSPTLPLSTVGIRIPNYEPINTILKAYKNPLATTSANLEATPPPKAHQTLNIRPDFIIPGSSGSGVPSTIIDISGPQPTLLREGEIKRTELKSLTNSPIKI